MQVLNCNTRILQIMADRPDGGINVDDCGEISTAVSAILECQNYELPPDQYELWKDNTLDFNPNLLFGT